MHSDYFSRILVLTVSLAFGCGQSEEAPVTTDMQEDFDHSHKHTHGQGFDHEHNHDDFEGSHAHPHSHGHRHGEPLYGGRIVSVGHTHHKQGETHFHTEVMPYKAGAITFHILSESSNGKLEAFGVKDTEIIGYLANADRPSASTQQLRFVQSKKSASEFSANVSNLVEDAQDVSVLIPKIVLGKQRFSFSFQINVKPAEDADEAAQDREASSTTEAESNTTSEKSTPENKADDGAQTEGESL